jgi:DnaJ-class molecular chaperone
MKLFRLKHFLSIRNYDTTKDYYKILNLSKTVKEGEIKKAFRELAKKYHPDYSKGKEDKFK